VPGVLILELHRTEIAERGVLSFGVVNLVDERRKVGGDEMVAAMDTVGVDGAIFISASGL
jgi:hypothetical protein